MEQKYEAMYEELLQFLYRTPWGLLQAARNGDIQMINPVAARLLMPLAFNARLDNVFDLLRAVRPELQALVAAAVERYCVVCEDLPLPGLRQPVVGAADAPGSVSISIFVQNQDTLMMVLRELHMPQQASNPDQAAELQVLHNLEHVGLLKTRGALIRWSNPAAQRMLGYAAQQLEGAAFADLFVQGVGTLLMESCQPALMAGASYTKRLPLLTRAAGSVTLDLSATITSFAKQEILWTLMQVPEASG